MLGVGLFALLAAAAAVIASSASASPEWGECTAQAGGRYVDAGCLIKAKKAGGSYEWKKGKSLAAVPFSGTSVGSGGVLSADFLICESERREPPGDGCKEGESAAEGFGVAMECEIEEDSGETLGTKRVANVTVVLRGCLLFGAVTCSNTETPGTIRSNPLRGTLGYISKAEREVGLLLEPATKGGEFVKLDCGGLVTVVVGVGNATEGAAYSPEATGGYDGTIAPITPVNTMTDEFTVVDTINENLENLPTLFEGKHVELLEAYLVNTREPNNSSKWSKVGQEGTNVNCMASPIEIRATHVGVPAGAGAHTLQAGGGCSQPGVGGQP